MTARQQQGVDRHGPPKVLPLGVASRQGPGARVGMGWKRLEVQTPCLREE